MAFQIDTIDCSLFLHLRCTGDLNQVNGPRILDEFADVFEASPHELVLLDCRNQQFQVSISDVYDLATYAAELLVGTSHKIAALVSEQDAVSISFFETTAVNRGLNVKHFVVEDDAIQWLVGSGPG